MRMWNIEPRLMCMKHLVAEHLEMHMFATALLTGRNIAGFIRKGLVDTGKVQERHDLLAEELGIRRGSHKSPLLFFSTYVEGYVDADVTREVLLSRCKDCAERIQNG